MHTPLKNQRHESFCQHVAKLESDVAAYQKAFKCSRASAEANASRMRENEGIQRRIAELQRASATAATLTIQERREIAAEIARDKTVAPAVRLSATVIEAKHAGEFMERAELRKDGAIPPLDFSSLTRNLPAIFFQPRQVDAEADTNGHANGTTAAAGAQP